MNQPHSSAPPPSTGPRSADSRYELLDQLGRGGMACVRRARDRASGKQVALKQLTAGRIGRDQTLVATLFEREFHTLAQLRHPHVIEVYDYGLFADGSAYYTMELLDGGDLRELSPLPWQKACGLFFEVCSSLALLHSRRVIHRDISPPNIRCTQDGHAKLIDFGAMVQMGTGGGDVVGTPAFIAPETLHRLALDARTDLFSLGATLYFALTGSVPYPARSFADVMSAWSSQVRAPSELVAGIPAALDDLVLSLVSVEPALRPHSAFDVMQQLAAIAGLPRDEADAVSRAYLATPNLVGREEALAQFRHGLLASRMARGKAMLLEGPAGIGRSRLLDACILEAKTLGFTVMRATAKDARADFSVAQDLTQHLLEASPLASGATARELLANDGTDAPRLRDFSDPGLDGAQLQRNIARFFWHESRKQPLLIAVDDVHRIDPQSAALLAGLLDNASRGRVFMVLTAQSDTAGSEAQSALARRCASLTVPALTSEQTRALLESVFGEVANLDLLAHEIHSVTHGVPRPCMELAQHLIDRALIKYSAGSWTLPSRLSTADLPPSASATVDARVALLSPHARLLAQALALAFEERLSDRQCQRLLGEHSAQQAENALSELVAVGAVLRHGVEYELPNRLWVEALWRSLDDASAQERQRALAQLYADSLRTAFIYHAIPGGLEEEGLAALAELNASYARKLDLEQALADDVYKMMLVYPRALASAERLGKGPRFVNELRRWHFAGSVLMEDANVPESSSLWLAQLRHDSGLDLYESDPDHSDPMQRLMRALQAAQARYQATPEALRVYDVEEALRLLAEYVVVGIAFGARTHDASLLRSLPGLLEPFAPLSPVLDAIWHNAIATYTGQGEGLYALARERWLTVLEKLDALDRNAMSFVDSIANAVALAIGLMEAQLGLPTAHHWAERLERDPAQRIAALQLRRIERLEQGDARGAERFRRQAELMSLQRRSPQMFKSLLAVELTACADARDLSGIQDVIVRMRPMAARFPHWHPNLLYAEACFHFTRGDYAAARDTCAECIALTEPDSQGHSLNYLMWYAAVLCLAEVKLSMGKPSEALPLLQRLVSARTQSGAPVPPEVARVLALAEAKLERPGAVERLQAAVADQKALGITGLRLGVTYEARAQIAIWQRDAEAFERYATLTAHEYRYGGGSALGARYERLINEARRQGLRTSATLDRMSAPDQESGTLFTDDIRSTVHRSMAQELTAQGRAQVALQLICSARGATAGQLYQEGPNGLALSASLGDLQAACEPEVISNFLARTRQREAELDEMSTDELETSADPGKTLVFAGTQELELLALSCMVDGELKYAGVVALPMGDGSSPEPREQQLLQTLAAHLLASGPQ